MACCPVEKKGGFPPISGAFPQEICEKPFKKRKSVVFDPGAISRLTEERARLEGKDSIAPPSQTPLQINESHVRPGIAGNSASALTSAWIHGFVVAERRMSKD